MENEKTQRLRGVLTAILTPFDAAGNLALPHFPALLDFQKAAGIDGVVVCGTNGEGTSLSVTERKRVLETVMAHRGNLTVIAGTGAASVTDAVELTRHAAEVGADAALVLPSFFFKKTTDEGLADYFNTILDAVYLPVLLYNIPQHSGVPITDGLLDLLDGHPNLAGIKDSAGDWNRTAQFIQREPRLRIFPGSDYFAAQGLANGAAGSISGGANAFPEFVTAVRDAHTAGGAELEAAQNRLTALTDILRAYPFVSTSKSVLAHRGLLRLGVRPPLVNLTAAQEEKLLSELRDGNFLAA